MEIAVSPMDIRLGDAVRWREEMKSFITALVLVASLAAPALANECPTLQAQIDAAIGTRYDRMRPT